MQIQVQSDFVGPLPADSWWQVNVTTDSEGSEVGWQEIWSSNSNPTFVLIGQPRATGHQDWPRVLEAGSTVYVQAELHTTGVVPTDTGTLETTWNPTVMAWRLTQQVTDQLADNAVTGGLTDEQATQLANTEERTQVLGNPLDLVLNTASGIVQTTLAQIFSRKTLDQLTLFEVTSGPTCDPVRATVGSWDMAVIVRLTTIADDLAPKTPDADWYFPDLAVLRVFRGVDLQYRRGIHTPTFMVENPWQWGWQFLNASQILGTPPDLTIAVDWRVGCCGQVFLMTMP